jgi:hypothetical protein
MAALVSALIAPFFVEIDREVEDPDLKLAPPRVHGPPPQRSVHIDFVGLLPSLQRDRCVEIKKMLGD